MLPMTVAPSEAPIRSSWCDDAGVGVELRARPQGHQVAPLLGVEQQHPLAVGEQRLVPARAHGLSDRLVGATLPLG